MCLQFIQSDLLIAGILGPLAGAVAQLDTSREQRGGLERDGPEGRTWSLSGQSHKCHCHSGRSCVNNNAEKVMWEL